ncbi:uncharacterized protein LOC120631141 [Pararge aegeria]|uniref:Calcium signal-modulating cyclophilin ligand n=1 Tax=Pararge aegeria TaxID=116150 RepID=S4PY65_9NEOP|nr:uncharacterized protein LOC120631141 [Pararge aegeria]
MAEAASARREARRRKILENSHNRLQIISGKSANEICKESSNITPIPTEFVDNSVPKESSSVIEHFLNNGVINAGVDSPQSFLSTNHESIALGDGDVTISSHNDEPFISQNSTAPTPESKLTGPTHWEMLTIYSSCKYDIVLLSCFLQLLYYFSLITFQGAYFFLPLILYVTTKNYLFPKQHNSNITNVLLLLNGMSPSKAQKIMSITQYVSDLFQDVCIYLFTTICLQSLLLTIEDSV